MAVLAVAALGAAVGYAFGYAALGWAIGSYIGQQLYGPDAPDTQGPRLEDLAVQSATYGKSIPRVFGAGRGAGNMIWSAGIKETKHVQHSGKGGGGSTATTYTYSCSFAIGLCEGPIVGIRRIWADGKLVLDRSKTAAMAALLDEKLTLVVDPESDTENRGQAEVRVYLGTEEQMPDPLIESYEGVGEVPAYRGLSYLVVEDMQLGPFGNRIPNLSVEVVEKGNLSGIQAVLNTQHQAFAEGLDDIDISNGVISACYPWDATYNRAITYASGPDVKLYAQGDMLNSTGELKGWPYRYYWNALGEYTGRAPYFYPGLPGFKYTQTWVLGRYRGLRVLYDQNPNDASYPLGYHSTVRLETWWPYGTEDTIVGVACDSSETLLMVWRSTGGVRYMDVWHGDLQRITVESPALWVENAHGLYQNPAAIENGKYLWYWQDSSAPSDVYLYRIDLSNGVSLIEELHDQVPFSVSANDVCCAARGGAFVCLGERNLRGFGRNLIDPLPVTLDSIVSDICLEAGLTASDIDVTDLAGIEVHNYCRTHTMTARAALTPLMQAYQFDIAESDVLRFRRRGGDVDWTIAEADLGAHGYGANVPAKTPRTRAQDVELPRELRVKYLDVDDDYQVSMQRSQRIETVSSDTKTVTLPIGLTGDDARQIAEIIHYTAWTERMQIGPLHLPARYLAMEPGDVLSVPIDGRAVRMRATQVDIALPGVVRVSGVVDDPESIVSLATGAAGRTGGQTITSSGPTWPLVLDIPALRDQDAAGGLYIAPQRFATAWPGAALYRSLDAGQSYDFVATLTDAGIVGEMQTTLADGPVGVWDRAGSFDVSLPYGALSGTTNIAVLNGANVAAIGSPKTGQFEIVQFRDVTLNPDGTYTCSHLLRGRRGTEWMTGQHTVAEIFVLLDPASLARINLAADDIGQARSYKAVTFGQLLELASEQSVTYAGRSLLPYSPAHLKARDNGNGTYDLSWVRRSRSYGEWRDYVGTPLDETTEAYRVIVEDGAGNQLSQADVSSPSATVTAAAGNVIKVAQLSDIVGPGFYAEIAL